MPSPIDDARKIWGPISYHRFSFGKCNIHLFGDIHIRHGANSCGERLGDVLRRAVAKAKRGSAADPPRSLDVFVEAPMNGDHHSVKRRIKAQSEVLEDVINKFRRHLWDPATKARWGDRVRFHTIDFHNAIVTRPKHDTRELSYMFAPVARGAHDGADRAGVARALNRLMYATPPASAQYLLRKPNKQFRKLPPALQRPVRAFMAEYTKMRVLNPAFDDPFEQLMELYAISRILYYAQRGGEVVVVAGACHTVMYAYFLKRFLGLEPTFEQYTNTPCVGPDSSARITKRMPASYVDRPGVVDCIWTRDF
jgi:hypothetical protein